MTETATPPKFHPERAVFCTAVTERRLAVTVRIKYGGRTVMAIIKDPEGRAISALQTLVNFKGQKVLDVGCGDGRLTRRYAGEAAQVTGIDPKSEAIETALADTPEVLKKRVQFFQASLEEYAPVYRGPGFDIIFFSWSLWWIEAEGMVHALLLAHRILRPDGVLISGQYLAMPHLIEVHSPGSIQKVGWLLDRDGFADERFASKALAQVVSDGHFILEDELDFEYPYHVDHLTEYQAWMAEWWSSAYHLEGTIPQLEDSLRAAGSSAKIVLVMKARLTRLKAVW
jgi:SAM-dependent methyltransferase